MTDTKPPRVVRFTWDGEAYDLDLHRLTFAEAAVVEYRTGLPLPVALQHAGQGSVTCLGSFAFVAIKRRRPTFTQAEFDQLENVEIGVEKVEQPGRGDDEADPSSSVSAYSPTD